MVLCDFFMLLGHYKRHCEAEMEAKPRRGGNDNYASTRYEQQLASFTLIHAIEVQLNVLGLASHEAQALLVSLPQFDAASANYIKKVAMVDAKAKKRSRKRFGEVHNYNGGLDFEDIADSTRFNHQGLFYHETSETNVSELFRYSGACGGGGSPWYLAQPPSMTAGLALWLF